MSHQPLQQLSLARASLAVEMSEEMKTCFCFSYCLLCLPGRSQPPASLIPFNIELKRQIIGESDSEIRVSLFQPASSNSAKSLSQVSRPRILGLPLPSAQLARRVTICTCRGRKGKVQRNRGYAWPRTQNSGSVC